MTFDPTVSFGTIFNLLALVVGGLVFLFAIRGEVSTLVVQVTSLVETVKEVKNDFRGALKEVKDDVRELRRSITDGHREEK